MFALLIVLAVLFGVNAITSLYRVAEGEILEKTPTECVWDFTLSAALLGSVIYAILSWV